MGRAKGENEGAIDHFTIYTHAARIEQITGTGSVLHQARLIKEGCNRQVLDRRQLDLRQVVGQLTFLHPVARGTVRTRRRFFAMETRDEGGIPLASNIRTNYAYHRMAVGLAVGIDFRTEVNYIPTKTSWLSNGLFKAGAVGVDALGIVEVSSYEA